MEIENLIVKPLFQCACNCTHCDERQDFFALEKSREMSNLDVHMILSVIEDAKSLGAKRLQISGGEPLLYPNLKDIIQPDMFTFINSTGWKIDARKAKDLMASGLGAFNLSLDSVSGEKHDSSRGVEGLFIHAMNAIRLFSPIYVNIQFILMKSNFRELPELIQLAIDNEVDSIYLMHIYGDNHGRFLLDEHEILELKKQVIPKALEVIRKRRSDRIFVYLREQFESIYDTRKNDLINYAQGRYWKDLPPCKAPYTSALVLPNGNVLPCCNMEHRGGIIMGNLKEKSLREIWNSKKYLEFRKCKDIYCMMCPSLRNRTFGLTEDMLRQFN